MKKIILFYSLIFNFLGLNIATADSNLKQDQSLYIAAKFKYNRSQRILCTDKLICGSPLVVKFYAANKYNPVWINDGKLTKSGRSLIAAIKDSYTNGLNPKTYHLIQINSIIRSLDRISDDNNRLAKQLADLDITLTDAFFLYASHLDNGLIPVSRVSRYWTPIKNNADYIGLINKAIKTDEVSELLDSLAPRNPMYAKLKEKLAYYYFKAADNNFEPIVSDEVLQIGSKGPVVKLIKQRLFATGELDKISNPEEFDKKLAGAVSEFQRNYGMEDDGVVGPSTLKALNASMESILRKISLNMDRLRMLPHDMGNTYVLINIPSYTLEAYRDNKLVLSMPVVVGKKIGSTCILNSKITYLELNPFWNVPSSIAGGEILPEIQKDPTFLSRHDMRVYTKNMTEVDPKSVDWSRLNAKNLPYRFRQDPSDINALGKIKFRFPNSCGLYLHDSLAKEAFDNSSRALSHGCVRLGKPFDFAAYLLANDEGWNKEKILTEIESDKRKSVTLTKPVNLYIVYYTALVDDKGALHFYDDLYKIDLPSLYPVWHGTKEEDVASLEGE